jgi:amino acid transporter
MALAGAALLLLDFASTAVVSAATATSYIANEVDLPFPSFVCTFAILVVFTVVCLTGVKESVRVAFVVLVFHVRF